MRSANENTRSMSCSISSTVTSRGSEATAARISWRSLSGTPAAGARQSAQHAAVRGQIGDVVSFQQDAAAVGPEHASQQVDDGGLAGAVRADQSVAGALLDLERKVARDLEPAEMLFQSPCFQRD